MTANGTTPPRYTHNNIESAIQEAKRLHLLHNVEVKILKVVGVVKKVEVPVTEIKTVVILEPDNPDIGDLPF
ncbi:hypothetical protein [Pedobacter nototheniae]|uniref:hypothetical protein n=1 Tax=Pedobacter nototheniae TaxID=2488994 RepID=UPI001B8C02F5|nr:hypothetical protein [Pedobacter nototheniae]